MQHTLADGWGIANRVAVAVVGVGVGGVAVTVPPKLTAAALVGHAAFQLPPRRHFRGVRHHPHGPGLFVHQFVQKNETVGFELNHR